jgi:hypothetical protein
MTTKAEKLVRDFFSFYLPKEKVHYNHRPNWLKNPMTGKNLELDIFYPRLNLAIEYNGFHHKIKAQAKKDSIKHSVCSKRGITLVNINAVYKINRYANRLYRKDPTRFVMFAKKVSPVIKREIAHYRNGNSPISRAMVRYITDTRFKINLDKFQKRQAEEIERNIRLREAKAFAR